ncbi:TrkH family potassium uptake protein [Zophobihabitans entericus]|uniref:Trk system potassium uptake protein n=1 Tax=Zophobihabitans entericus TaxID=1635327 RepID=A0A6G9I999_9GAMM|nr:TrkH family potassium uptake protein [Zophobihabitans entericus]QIQ20793.1 potassium transporter [Zophobihabitans entericus]
MHVRSIIRIVGLLITLLSFFMLLPGIVALIYRDGGGAIFIQSFVAALILGCVLWIPNHNYRSELNTREGFLIVVLFWVVLGTIGAFPFLFDSHINLDITNAFFESFSGLTTTGATTISGLDKLPKALLFYRQLLQWLGGMGIIVLAVAILPLLGVGGMQLYRAEIPGPQKDSKMRPRIAQTAKTLWFIYMLITVVCACSLWFAGMDWFDAISHSFSTIAMGGFSTHDAGLAHFNNPIINYIITFFLILAGCNFGLHFVAFKTFNPATYWRDQEFRTFIFILLALVIISTIVIYWTKAGHVEISFDQLVLQVVATATTTGYSVDDINKWPAFLPILLVCASFIGSCAGSTGGGLKVVRVLLLYLQGVRELKRLVHPNAIYSLKLGNKVLPERIIESVWGFLVAYMFVFLVSFFIIIASGIDASDAFYIVATSLNNLGLGLGSIGDSFAGVNDITKWVMIIDMLFGRLEIFTLLVLFTPTFWRS